MAYWLGIDGGNSKTHALIVDDRGWPTGFGASGGSDFQEVGLVVAQREWRVAIQAAIDASGLEWGEIDLACFCLAGADLPEDYSYLDKATAEVMYPVRTLVKNDTMAALRAGLHEAAFGVTIVVGAGFNAAGRGKQGEEIVLPGLGYISGDYGGGRWLGRQMIRAIMRAWDGRGKPTQLTALALDAMGIADELELIRHLRQEENAREELHKLVPLLFEAAYEGDEVAQMLLIRLGQEVGLTANTLIRKLGLEEEEVPIVLSTSVFRGKGPLLIDVVTTVVHQVAPKAKVMVSEFLPVVGAALDALEEGHVRVDRKLLKTLRSGLAERYPDLLSG